MTAAVTDLVVRPLERVDVQLRAPDDELLLVEWLNALVYEISTRACCSQIRRPAETGSSRPRRG